MVERLPGAIVERRTARKRRICDEYGAPHHYIEPGEVYLLHKAFPNHDINTSGKIWTLAECSPCASRYRQHLLDAPSDSGPHSQPTTDERIDP